MATKAAKIIHHLQNNRLASSVIKAVAQDDPQSFLNAVAGTNLEAEDLSLSSSEVTDFIKGRTPSGELDIVTWEGYYEVADPSSSYPFALLILNTPQRVYWGNRDQLLSDPYSHKVDYELTTDGKLDFIAGSGREVSITLTRTYDDHTGIAIISFEGTLNGAYIKGGWAKLPLSQPKKSGSNSAGTTAHSLKVAAPSSIIHDVAAAIQVGNSTGSYDGSGGLGDDIVNLVKSIWPAIEYIYGSLGNVAALIQLCLWAYEVRQWSWGNADDRQTRSRRVRSQLNEASVEYNALALENCEVGPVNFKNASSRITNDANARLNQQLNDHSPNWETTTTESITQDLRDLVKAEVENSLRKYIRNRISAIVEEELNELDFLPFIDEVVKNVVEANVSKQADPKLKELDTPSTSYDPIIQSRVTEARETHYASDYAEKEAAYNGAQKDYEDVKKHREDLESRVTEIDKKIAEEKSKGDEAAAQQEQARKDQLDKDLEKAKQDERDKDGRQKDAASREKEAKKKKEAAEKEAKDTDSKKWDGKLAEVFK